MELTQGWRAVEADDDLRRTYYGERFDDRAWEPITVPGHWRSQPAFAASDGPLLHRCRFSHPGPEPQRRAWLTFDGLFYQGDHWLDGAYLGDTEGYFMPHTFEVTEAFQARTEHTLALEVTCAPQTDKGAKRNVTGAFQSGLGLDPDWNPGGLWRPVRISETGPVRIAQLRMLCREATEERAVVSFHAVLDSDAARTVQVQSTIGHQYHGSERPLASGANSLDWTLTVERPALWWPRALGDPVLHDVRVAIQLDAAEGGSRSDERAMRTGLRSVRLRNWICTVNGERLFLKGSNLAPTRMALGEATAAQLRRDVDLAVETGLDLLRIHAHITRPEVYDAADEAGLLLWQDFPLQAGYARGIRRQAAHQARAAVDLLGHHPSVAVWCGHDAPRAMPRTARTALPTVDEHLPSGPGMARRLDSAARRVAGDQLPSWNKTVLDGAVKRALQRADPTRPVVPHSGVTPHPPRFDGTDSHLSFGWAAGDERSLAAFCRVWPRMVRFVSEFGAQAVPSGDSAAFLDPERWPDLDWAAVEHRHGLDKAIFDKHVPPADYAAFEDWQAATQRHQAQVVKHHVETLRRLKYRPTGGFAQFFFADGHPAVSSSVLDHERVPKLGLAALREACRPVIVVADRPPATVAPGNALAWDVHVVSDQRDPIGEARLTARLSWTGGEHEWHWAGGVPADSCVRAATLQLVVPPTPGPLMLDLDLRLPDGVRVTNHYDSTIRG
ncbi:MAG: glycoside hydrolase family 2 protein [Acidimicrobiales bacterium]